MKVYCIKKTQNGLEYYLSYDEKRYTTFLPHAGFYETRDEAKEILNYEKHKWDAYFETYPDKIDERPEYEILEVEINIISKHDNYKITSKDNK